MKNTTLLLTAICILMMIVQCTAKKKDPNKEQSPSIKLATTAADENRAPIPASTKQKSVKQESSLTTFLKYSSKDELIRDFGEENLTHSEKWLEEGTVKKEFSVLFEGTDDEVHIIWDLAGPLVEINNPLGRWEVQCIKPGTTLAQLVAIKNAPICFYGFGWDNGGSVVRGDQLISNIGMELILTMPFNHPEAIDFMGDQTISSDTISHDIQELISVQLISLYHLYD